MAAQLGRVGEARSWFEEGTRSAEGAASVALWQVRTLGSTTTKCPNPYCFCYNVHAMCILVPLCA